MIRHTIVAAFAAALMMPATVFGGVIMIETFEDVNNLAFTLTETGTNNAGGLFHDTNRDHFTIVPENGTFFEDDPYTGFGGANFFSANDIDDPQGPGHNSQTLNFVIDITGRTDLSFSGLFATSTNEVGGSDPDVRYDASDGLRVRAQIDNGPVQDLVFLESEGGRNTHLAIDTDFDGTGDGARLTGAFTELTSLIQGTGSSLLLTVEVHADSENETFAFDNITVSGIVPEPTSSMIMLGVLCMAGFKRRFRR